MKKSELKAGVVYGYQRGSYGYVTPAVLLDAKTLWTTKRSGGFGASDGHLKYVKSTDNRYSAGDSWLRYSNEVGYLALMVDWLGDEDDKRKRLDAAKTVAAGLNSTPDDDAVNNLKGSLPDGVRLDLVNNRWLIAEYEDAVRAEADKREAREAQWIAERDEARRQMALTKAINEALQLRGIGDNAVRVGGEGNRAHLKLSTLAELLGVESA